MTLKTFDDGSEFTLVHVGALAAFGVVATAATCGVIAVQDKLEKRKYDKMYGRGKYAPKNKEN